MLRWILRLLLLAGLVAAIVTVVMKAQEKKQLADETAQDIEDTLADLDPATRAAVIAKLGKDAAASVHSSD